MRVRSFSFFMALAFALWHVKSMASGVFPVVSGPDDCSTAADISPFFAAGTGIVQMAGTYDNTGATADPGDPAPACFAETGSAGPVNNSLWFTFTTNGGLFHLETIPCNSGGQYISGGDTQMAVYQGSDCNNLTPVACNDDLYDDNDPNTDFRAGLDLQTVAGQKYYMMIDGYASGSTVATGMFCIQIVRMASIPCAAAAAGTFQIGNYGFLCIGDNLLNTLTFDAESFIIPNEQPMSGMSWAVTALPIPAGTWPGNIPGVISTTLSPEVIPVSLQNNITSSEPLVFYFTPVVVGGAALINPAAPAKLPNLDISSGCFALGATRMLTLVPLLEPLHGQITPIPASADQSNGAITVVVNGGYPASVSNPSLYQFLWSTGATTPYANHLAPGAYSVLISDPSGCTESITLSTDVIVPVTEQHAGIDLALSPNPVKSMLALDLQLQAPATVEIEILNIFGQTLQHLDMGKTGRVEQLLDLRDYPDGMYFVQVQADRKAVLRKVMIQH